MNGGRLKLLSLVVALLVSMAIRAGAVPVHAGPAEGPPGADRLLAPLLTALNMDKGPAIDTAGLSRANWRVRLAPTLARVTQVGSDLRVLRPLAGRVLAGTLYLPATVTLTGDTTIIARRIVFAGNATRITTHGHALHLYQIDGTWIAAKDGGTVTIDASGGEGHAGNPGATGSWGLDGWDGWSGGSDWWWCFGESGEDGEAGSPGYQGDDGGDAAGGGSGGPITLDIPDGSTTQYVLKSNGGTGGVGGSGGSGGTGGIGGRGGDGGDAETQDHCYGVGAYGGDGGKGGTGSDGGKGGNGGRGGDGGNGGTITVSYPAGYDPNWITTEVSGGSAGSGGAAGDAGIFGLGGFGGRGGRGDIGFGGGNGQDGESGDRGGNGSAGNAGAAGNAGSDGTVQITQR